MGGRGGGPRGAPGRLHSQHGGGCTLTGGGHVAGQEARDGLLSQAWPRLGLGLSRECCPGGPVWGEPAPGGPRSSPPTSQAAAGSGRGLPLFILLASLRGPRRAHRGWMFECNRLSGSQERGSKHSPNTHPVPPAPRGAQEACKLPNSIPRISDGIPGGVGLTAPGVLEDCGTGRVGPRGRNRASLGRCACRGHPPTKMPWPGAGSAVAAWLSRGGGDESLIGTWAGLHLTRTVLRGW